MELEHYELLKKQKDLIAEGQSFQVVDINP